MENREKLEIPTINFTPVTLLNAGGNSCVCNIPTTTESGEITYTDAGHNVPECKID